ncbi:MAG: 50S ribosomal protein L15 [Saprospiraceae bacterium]|nr:50S ribosomal protein L15 [Saprospiraceae bacterium]MCB0543602.1 50S ribosomal protein L15 [Saprospiraceae bacterium]MCB0574115.1 50S ribosomal protein L15 [Saprospiraceae bacterium]MCB9306057.1 50S ribosomal protein L15 [Lewinellaceae bacterium]MCB9356251.1 50S ribosomal protein L15 [Lewinellaceae bacterium]
MELSNLRPANGSVKSRKRIGRGTGSGRGGTSTRGHKGDKARSGSKEKRHFEGGQTPMQRRLPKRGFKNINRVEYIPLNLGKLESLVQKTGNTSMDIEAFVAAGVAKATDRIKVLGNGKLSSKVNIKVHAISASAKSAIEAAGGSVELV